jgi:hypothetical protein
VGDGSGSAGIAVGDEVADGCGEGANDGVCSAGTVGTGSDGDANGAGLTGSTARTDAGTSEPLATTKNANTAAANDRVARAERTQKPPHRGSTPVTRRLAAL